MPAPARPHVHVAFESLPFEQAVNYFRSLNVVPTTSYRDMWALEGRRAFTVAKLTQLDLLEDVHRHLDRAIEEGTSLAEFQEQVGDLLQRSGWGAVGPRGGKLASTARLENIYRTNLASAYAAGEWDQMRESAVARAKRGVRTFLTYNAVGDERTREEHAELDGTTLPIDDSFWSDHTPPIDYECRCWLTEETDENPDTKETDKEDIPNVAPGKGFGGRDWDAAVREALAARVADTWPELRETMEAVIAREGDEPRDEG